MTTSTQRPAAPGAAVLKFGSSVLTSAEALPDVVQEIYRARRAGHGVVAVVSAFGDRTDELVAEANALGLRDERARAGFIGAGERASATRLVAALEAAGQPARLLEPPEIGLDARGPRLAATPIRVDPRPIRETLAEGIIAIVPGFVARHEEGGPCLLGRGGSDLSALVLAHALTADRCVLFKDTEGLYEHDPNLPGPPPRRYATLTFATARTLDGVLQAAAAAWAEAHHFPFDVTRPGSPRLSRVGADRDQLEAPVSAAPPLRVALAGLGAVGAAVLRGLRGDPRFDVVGLAVRDLNRERPADLLPPGLRLSDDLGDLIEAHPDVVVELIGGTTAAATLVRRALDEGIDVVTANKALLFAEGGDLSERARLGGRRLRDSASVGGGLPVLETLASIPPNQVDTVEGSLNGTAAFVLEQLESGQPRPVALRAARAAGYAEADASRDLSGQDSLEKIGIVARRLGGDVIAAARRGLADDEHHLAPRALAAGQRRRLIARARRGTQPAGLAVDVLPLTLDAADFLAGGEGPENRVRIRLRNGEEIRLAGAGAGGAPTALSVLADLGDLARLRQRDTEGVA